jgi:thiol-disulfide isomerase/thioredoxin
MPTEQVGHAEAAGAAALGNDIPVGGGKWTWINLWAAWCGPCKEEMPRLQKWQQKLSANMNLQFVSLDDDQRQLMRFLEAQPKDGSMRASYWLPEGKTRDNWLSAQHLKNPPQLPVQILVNPQGKVHCIIEGAVDEVDFPAVSAIVTH